MDALTHILGGTLLAKTGFSQKTGKTATITFTIGAILPDIDYVMGFTGPLSSLKYHRSFTHSFFGSIPEALILGGIIYYLGSYKRYWNLVIFSILGIWLHIFLDLLTSFGTLIFSPLTSKRYALDLIFIIDPYFTSIIIIALLLTIFFKKISHILCRFAVFLLFLYIVLLAFNHNSALEYGRKEIKKTGIDIKNISALPLPFNPFKWAIISEGKDYFYRTNINLLNKSNTQLEIISKGDNNKFSRLADETEEVRVYRWFARFPVSKYTQSDKRHIVEYYDLRFGFFRGRRPFHLKIIFDDNGRVIDKRFR